MGVSSSRLRVLLPARALPLSRCRSRVLAGGVVLADDGRQEGIEPQHIVVVEVLVAQGQGVDPLGDEVLEGVLDELGDYDGR